VLSRPFLCFIVRPNSVCWRHFFSLSRNRFQPTHGDPISWPGGVTRFALNHPIDLQSSVTPGRAPTMSPPGILSDGRFDSLECSLRLLANQVERLAAAPPASVSVPLLSGTGSVPTTSSTASVPPAPPRFAPFPSSRDPSKFWKDGTWYFLAEFFDMAPPMAG
jgi:hypothetical protein